jgi:hypothetical protein
LRILTKSEIYTLVVRNSFTHIVILIAIINGLITSKSRPRVVLLHQLGPNTHLTTQLDMASNVVAVAGGTGKLGRALVEELVAHGGYKVLVLSREVGLFQHLGDRTRLANAPKANAQKAKELGVEIVVADYHYVDSVVKTLEASNIDTVISTLGSTFGPDLELALIQATEKSKTTKRYIPSIWGISCTPE